jgi:molybdate transport system regulatory protein
MARLSIRIDFEPSGKFLGPGMVELLERIAQFGSISKGAYSMGMSYRKGWLLVDEMQKTFGGRVAITKAGGSAGGGAELTNLGRSLLKTYRAIEASVARAVDEEIQSLSAMTQKTDGPRTKRPAKSRLK